MEHTINRNHLINKLNNADIDKLLQLSREELSNCFGEVISIQKDYDQNNPHHCYSLLEHTLRTVKAVRDMDIEKEDKDILLVSALYHDIGKPSVKFEKNGRSVFYGHAEKSKELAQPILSSIGFSSTEIKRILFFIEYHDAFINYKLSNEPINKYSVVISEESIKAFINDMYIKNGTTVNDIILLIKLATADVIAQSDEAIINGRIAETKENKLNRLFEIEKLINESL